MSKQSNDLGRAYEYACITTLSEELSKIRRTNIETTSSYFAAERAYKSQSEGTKAQLRKSALAAIDTLFGCEPMMTECGADELTLISQTDACGEDGDVRDIIIVRRKYAWEVGLSVKHNHLAVKHSRLAKDLDFGLKWYDVPCSAEYWHAIGPIFSRLQKEKQLGKNWSDLDDKVSGVYRPILNAFLNEINEQYKVHPEIPKRLVEYLLGKFDFYKVISHDDAERTDIIAYNLRGTLNKASQTKRPVHNIPISVLPKNILASGFVPGHDNTVFLALDNGWSFTFRIHNAASAVQTSLKFDVRMTGSPTSLVMFNCVWRKSML